MWLFSGESSIEVWYVAEVLEKAMLGLRSNFKTPVEYTLYDPDDVCIPETI
jgi:hypothetical protein